MTHAPICTPNAFLCTFHCINISSMFRCNVPWNFDWTSPLVKQKWFTAQDESLIFPNNLSKTLLTLEEATKERTTMSKQIVWATIYGYQVAKYEWCLQKFNLSQYNCILSSSLITRIARKISIIIWTLFSNSAPVIFFFLPQLNHCRIFPSYQMCILAAQMATPCSTADVSFWLYKGASLMWRKRNATNYREDI